MAQLIQQKAWIIIYQKQLGHIFFLNHRADRSHKRGGIPLIEYWEIPEFITALPCQIGDPG